MRKLLILATIAGVLIVSGCSKSDNVTAPGGSTADWPDEVQKVVDAYTIDGQPQMDQFQWQMVTSTDPNDVYTNYDTYMVTLIWGDFFDINPNTDPLDWSGSIWVNGDAIIEVKYLIDFEAGQDSILPSDMPFKVPFNSTTQQDFDGISILVYLNTDITYIMEPNLIFDTGPLNQWMPFSLLVHLDAFYPINTGQGLAVHARKIGTGPCPNGTMEGRWLTEAAFDNSGTFNGIWYSDQADSLGYLTGQFWMDFDAAYPGGRMTGSVSGIYTDQVIAELFGIWFYDDPRMCPMCGVGHGQFYGYYHNLIENSYGWFKGEFGDWSVDPNDLVDMPFSGYWQKYCRYQDIYDYDQTDD